MTYYNWREENIGVAKIFDAKGKQYKRVLWCNTETGEIEYTDLDNEGKSQFDYETNEVKTIITKVPAPLKVEFSNEK